jgi:hypothetical protein
VSETLEALAGELAAEGTPVSDVVADAATAEGFASGRHADVVERVREGYLLHYGESRLLPAADPDLALLAGDYLYALGIQLLAASGDCEGVLSLAELIGASATRHAEGRPAEVPALWEATTASIAAASQ